MSSELFEKDWKYVVDTIYRINAKTELGDMEYSTLQCLRSMIPFCQGLFHVYTREGGTFHLHSAPVVCGDEPRYMDLFLRDYVDDAFFSRASVTSYDEVFRDTDMFPDEIRMQTRWYRDIYTKQGIHFALRCHLAFGGQLIGSIDLFRPKDDVDFSDKEVRILGILSRHISLKLDTLLQRESIVERDDKTVLKLIARYGLTVREGEVVKEIISCRPDAEIADKLCISPSTLKKHIHNIYHKADVGSRSQLLALVQEVQ